MININYTHTSNHSSSAKLFKFTSETDLTIDQKVPNQAKQIINYAYELSKEQETFTYSDLADYIDTHHVGTFTTSKGGTMRIIRYYSKLLQTTGVLLEA